MSKANNEVSDLFMSSGQAEEFPNHLPMGAIDICNQNCQLCEAAIVNAVKDDVYIASQLRWHDQSSRSMDPVAIGILAMQLDQWRGDDDLSDLKSLQTAACSRHVAKERQRLGASLDELFDEEGEDRYEFEIMPRRFFVDHGDLEHVSAPEFVQDIVQTLDDLGIDNLQGMLMGFFYAESDPIREVYRFGVRGVASGELVELIQALEAFPRFNENDLPDSMCALSADPIGKRINVALADRPTAHMNHLAQPCWPQRRAVCDANAVWQRVYENSHVPHSNCAEIALWLNKWSLSDLTMMIGLADNGNGSLWRRLQMQYC